MKINEIFEKFEMFWKFLIFEKFRGFYFSLIWHFSQCQFFKFQIYVLLEKSCFILENKSYLGKFRYLLNLDFFIWNFVKFEFLKNKCGHVRRFCYFEKFTRFPFFVKFGIFNIANVYNFRHCGRITFVCLFLSLWKLQDLWKMFHFVSDLALTDHTKSGARPLSSCWAGIGGVSEV